jgi:hypothetical protein
VKPGFQASLKRKILRRPTIVCQITIGDVGLPQNDSSKRICHSEGAIRSGLMAQKKKITHMLIETTATEESLAEDRQG